MSKSIDNLRDKLDGVIPTLSEENITNFMVSKNPKFYLEKYGIANAIAYDSESLNAGDPEGRWIPPTALCPTVLSVPGHPEKC